MKAKQKPEAAAVWMPIADLTPWADNPRDNAAAVPEVAKSITRFGFASPIIARPIEGGFEIIAGHTRHQAALSLGLDRVPVRVMDLDPTDAKLLALADNKVGEIATWSDGLGDLLKSLEADGIDLDGLGFGDDELQSLVGNLSDLGEDWADALNDLPEGDRAPIQTMTFTLHDDQVVEIKRAISIAKDMGDFVDTGNINGNGNALARVCELFSQQNGA